MSTLEFQTLRIPAGRLGPDNPLPPLGSMHDSDYQFKIDPQIDAQAARSIGWRIHRGILPHRMQDDYDRDQTPRPFRVAVLENQHLQAIFMLEHGGKLWSLIHKPSRRQLLGHNPVMRYGNLALRSAWVMGGVEWNLGIVGHTPYSCSPLFAARLERPDGTPVLRMYEWDRIRQIPYQINACLPDDSRQLFVHVYLDNRHDHEIPMYWWSNMGVVQAPDVRVVVPAEQTYSLDYEQRALALWPLPLRQNRDISYPSTAPYSIDYFFRLPESQRPWMAAVDGQGRGVLQTSTSRLRGRKLFCWGIGPGGRRWQSWLTPPDAPLFEIQAGLAPTQMQCLPMPARTVWSWLETYGPIEVDPQAVHGQWNDARRCVQEYVDGAVPHGWLEAQRQEMDVLAQPPPRHIDHRGSGWGALERQRREQSGEPPISGPGTVFDDQSLGPEQAQWRELLHQGALSAGRPDDPPGAWMVQADWRRMLEASVQTPAGDHWRTWLHLGVMRYADDQHEAARQAWERSIQLQPSAWALRNLALDHQRRREPGPAAEFMQQALALLPRCRPLIIETMQLLLEDHQPRKAIQLYERLDESLASLGRIRFLYTRALLDDDRLEDVARIIDQGLEIPDLREGELSLTEVWYGMHEKRLARLEGQPIDEALRQRVRREFPPPAEIDFRMTAPAEQRQPCVVK